MQRLLTSLLLCLLTNATLAHLAPSDQLQAILLAAGGSTRFNSGKTKLGYDICGQKMIIRALSSMIAHDIPTTIVVGHQKEDVIQIITDAHIPHISFVEQKEQLGTGHAVLTAREFWHADHILIMNGDMPLVMPKVIEQLWDAHLQQGAAISIVTTYCIDPEIAYGRIVETEGKVEVIEAKHFTASIADYPYVNAGIYLIRRDFLETYLPHVQQNSVTKEFYITDLIKLASDNDYTIATSEAPFEAIHGVNTLKQLVHVEHIKRTEFIEQWMKQGVHFIMPHTVHIDEQVTIGKGSTIGAGVQLRGNTHIGNNCIIEPYCILKNAVIADNQHVAAFTH